MLRQKHFERLAGMIATTVDECRERGDNPAGIYRFALRLAEWLAGENPRFKRCLFLEQAKVTETDHGSTE
ncbi:MAG: hypothetical protein GY906_23115 [bacterium]|nr:hypothetical protein [bacterium]